MTVLCTSLENIPLEPRGGVLVIGNFDGVHLGHRSMLAQAKDMARKIGAPLDVLTFEPHPRQFFQPESEPFRLTLLPMKQRLMEEIGVDRLFALEFNQAFSQLGADEFIDRILIQKLQARHIVVGTDFSFGRGRSGTVETLKNKPFSLSTVAPVTTPDGLVYSSTAIRTLLRQGQFPEAESLLGWPWQMEAPVVHGDKRGRTLGFPTANQDMTSQIRIPYGVYAVKIRIEGETGWRNGCANFGIRPMFQRAHPIFETFIFDFNDDIYGKNMLVRPIRRLRQELAFPGLPSLVAQIEEDCIAAKAVLLSPGSV